MKTELEYANELIEKYYFTLGGRYLAIQHSIIDVENTIEALNGKVMCGKSILTYYQNVLQILKDKL